MNKNDKEIEQDKDVKKDMKDSKNPKSKKAGAPKAKGPAAFLKSNRFKRGTMSMIMTAVFVVIVVLVNIMAGILSDRFPSINVDLTAQGLNTLSEDALDAAKAVEKETEIIILMSETDASQIVDYTQVVNLAERMNEVNRLITVEFTDLDENPTFANDYEGESLRQGDVIVRTEGRYKYLGMYTDLFAYNQDQQTGATTYYSKVDGAMAQAIEAVNSDTTAKVAFAAGHSEQLPSDYRAGFEQLLKDNLYEIEEFSLMTEDIPEDANVVILPAPTTDFAEDEIQKLRNYLSETSDIDHTLFYIAIPGLNTPKLDEFLQEWGVEVRAEFAAETDQNRWLTYNPLYIVVDNASEMLAENQYGFLAAPGSAVIDPLFAYNDDISVGALWKTADTAVRYTDENTDFDQVAQEELTVATLSRKMMDTSGQKYNNLVTFGSYSAFMDQFAASNAYGNKSYYGDLLSALTGMDAVTGYVQPVQTSGIDIVASASTLSTLGMTVFTIAVPAVILAAGLIIYLRRRHK